MGALGIAFGIGKKIFKGLRSRRKQKKLARRQARLSKKEAEAKKALSNLIAGGTDTSNYNTALTPLQKAAGLSDIDPDFTPAFDLGMGKFKYNKRGLAAYNADTNNEIDDNVKAGFNIKALPMWAKGLGLAAALFLAWKLFTKKKRR